MAQACRLCGSVGGEDLEKGQWPLLTSMPDTSVTSFMPLGPFQLLSQWWSSEGVSLSRWIHVWVLRGTASGSRSFFHWLSPHQFLQLEVVGTYLLGAGTLGWGAWCAVGSPCSWDIRPEFFSTTHGWGTSPARSTSAPLLPVWMDVVSLIPYLSDSIQLDFWWFCVMAVLSFSFNFDVVAWQGKPCLFTLPSWPEVQDFFL